jgi:hypothetical protein
LHGLTTISGKSVVCMRLGLVDEAFFYCPEVESLEAGGKH